MGSSGRVQFADTEKARRHLDQNGIEFVASQVLPRHLPRREAEEAEQQGMAGGQMPAFARLRSSTTIHTREASTLAPMAVQPAVEPPRSRR
jgi:hypothetical protein